MHVWLGSNILMQVGVRGDLLMHIFFSGNLLMQVRLGSDLGIDIWDGSRVEVSIGYRGVDSSVNSGQGCGSVSHRLGSHGGSVAISIRGSSIASGKASISIASIGGWDNSGGGRGQTGENRDKGFHV